MENSEILLAKYLTPHLWESEQMLFHVYYEHNCSKDCKALYYPTIAERSPYSLEEHYKISSIVSYTVSANYCLSS